MEKADLMEYLKAVCEAEEAAYACEETIGELELELQNNNQKTIPPIKPQKGSPQRVVPKETGPGYGCLLSVVFGILGFVILFEGEAIHDWVYADVYTGNDHVVLKSLVVLIALFAFPLVGFLSGTLLTRHSNRRDAETQNNEFQRQVDFEYAQALKRYENDLAFCREEDGIKNELSKIISEAIYENKTALTRIKSLLKKLYDQGIIYSPFQNTIAVHQIRQYLEMGLCDALDGPAGAYAEYMKDVRAQRICDSIQDMKQAVLGALNQIAANQQLLYREMRQVNEHIVSLQKSMESGLQAIQGEIAKTRNASAQAMAQWEDNAARSNTAVNKQMEEMRRILLASAQNQYIVQRERFANDWWNRNRLQQP